MDDQKLTSVAEKCIDSSDRQLFIVGPPRSGKTTRLPVIIAALTGKKVLCLQPNDKISRNHVEWVHQSESARQYGGKEIKVGYYKDETEIPFAFVPKYDVNYVSYKWWYRMVIKANSPYTGIDEDEELLQRCTMQHNLRRSGQSIGYIILDEFHSQSIQQELGYIAVDLIFRGKIDSPVGVFEETKAVITTAYHENTFQRCFQLSEEEIDLRTIKMSQQIQHPITEAYEEKEPRNYHMDAVKKAKEILQNNGQACILIFVDTIHSTRNIVRQSSYPQEKITIIDLEVDRIVDSTRPMIIVATPDFSSRIPIQGITDVICPRTLLLPVMDDTLYREVLKDLPLAKWELEWASNHLDSNQQGTIHYMFRHQQFTDHADPRFTRGDFIDLFIGMTRLYPEWVISREPICRFRIPLTISRRALRQLSIRPPIFVESESRGDISDRYFIINDRDYMKSTLELMDLHGIDRRQAYFFGVQDSMTKDNHISQHGERFARMVGVAMISFDEAPILRRVGPSNQAETMRYHFPHLQDHLFVGPRRDYTADSWMNAVIWMDIRMSAAKKNMTLDEYCDQCIKLKGIEIDRLALNNAELRLRCLAGAVGVRGSDDFCNGTLLKDVKRSHDKTGMLGRSIEVLWRAYLFAYRFNLIFIRCQGETVTIRDICSGQLLQYSEADTVINMIRRQSGTVQKRRIEFYAVASVLKGNRVERLTVMPDVVIIEQQELEIEEAENLHELLKLK
ncbi:hypothetical protein SAMD00023353_1002950 [Rosellinia necatrix]|uniref:Uncharacterized protein n=1 Tax=Rosellinia necatrix TaxID=77044 RepID=A0A1W2TBG2_ROSNE|nr:hypothetical protein SAMD00023353_1002950 [Rosellinia necatrix]